MAQPVMRPISAAILAGGQSRRMGTDKALLDIGGETLLERTIRTIQQVTDDIVIVGDRTAYHEFGVPVFPDRFPQTGPLGGIATALGEPSSEHVLVVACDMPLLSGVLLRALADEPRDYDVLVPVVSSHDRDPGALLYHSLHAIYAKRCLPAIEAQLAAGNLRVTDTYAGLKVRSVDEAWLRQFDPDLESFMNANDPGQWDVARARLLNEL